MILKGRPYLPSSFQKKKKKKSALHCTSKHPLFITIPLFLTVIEACNISNK